jgi:ABC-type oligopeptide transport system substrate-binding subunit
VGIQVEQSTSEWAAFHDVLESGSFQLARFGWVADYPTLDDFLYPLFHSTASSNYSRYANPEVDAALTAARQVADEDERRRAYRDVHALVGRDMPVIPLLFHSHNHVGSNRVGRLTYDPQGHAHLEDATMA